MIHAEWSPLPASLAPMLAAPGSPPTGRLAEWAVEMKWDGVRALAFVEDGVLRLVSRTGKDISRTYPEVCRACGRRHRRLLLDGEIVAFTDGAPDFEALQPRMHVSSADAALRLSSLDPGHVPGVRRAPTGGRPADSRSRTLRAGKPSRPSWGTVPAFSSRPISPDPTWTPSARPRSPPGSRASSSSGSTRSYEPGARSGNWLKVKNLLRQEVVVAGWKPGQGNRAGLIGSLLVGVHSGIRWRCCTPGTSAPGSPIRCCGCSPGGSTPLRRPDSPFDGPVPPEYARPAVWVEPRLVIEVDVRPVDPGGSHAGPGLPGAA